MKKTMLTSENLDELETARQNWNRPVAFVPTMGALHQGHLDLIDLARHTVGPSGTVVVSIFVNPLQFDRAEDLTAYPRTLEEDLVLCREKDIDHVFHPQQSAFYHNDHSIQIRETLLSQHLCGASRPGHFDGVCTVVLRLFNVASPDYAIFGKKDYQQLSIIRRLVRDTGIGIRIIAAETTREPDGLALSSRNRNLTPSQRADAPRLRRSLLAALALAQSETGALSASAILDTARQELFKDAPADFRLDYLQLVDRKTLQPVETLQQPTLLAIAAFYGSVRLIDNIELASSQNLNESRPT